MTTIYADTSALARAYFVDEPEHAALRSRLFESGDSIVSAAVTIVELTRALSAKRRGGRPIDVDAILDHYRANVATIRLDARHLEAACSLVVRHTLGTLDAIHVGVATDAWAKLGDPLTFLTRDRAQALAARAEGLTVA